MSCYELDFSFLFSSRRSRGARSYFPFCELEPLELVVLELVPFEFAELELVDVPEVCVEEKGCCVSPLVDGVPETWKGPKRMGWKDILNI